MTTDQKIQLLARAVDAIIEGQCNAAANCRCCPLNGGAACTEQISDLAEEVAA